MTTATVQEAKSRLSQLIDAALRGEEVLIARDGVPAVRLVPVEEQPKRRREPGRLAGQAVEIDPDWWKPDDELARLFEGDDTSFDRS